MKERPILFSAPMVRAILAGTKTQTRREVSNPHRNDGGFVLQDYGKGLWPYRSHDGESVCYLDRQKDGDYYSEAPLRCPYGKPGDRLWVRETWADVPRHEPRTDEDLPWREDGRILVYAADAEWEGARQFLCADGVLRWAKPDRWRPSIHMPRWASRITLEVTGVRVERLQDISEADALAEGVESAGAIGHLTWWRNYLLTDAEAECSPALSSTRDSYRTLWESINGPGSWDANPWVWVIEFSREG